METPRDVDRDKAEMAGLDYDKVLDHIGQFGAFQRKIFLWLSFISAAAGLAVVAFAFTGLLGLYVTKDKASREKGCNV